MARANTLLFILSAVYHEQGGSSASTYGERLQGCPPFSRVAEIQAAEARVVVQAVAANRILVAGESHAEDRPPAFTRAAGPISAGNLHSPCSCTASGLSEPFQ
jgi:hypothetical protein